jgi:GntR family transcriptional regulator, carbon starvation induced regulator
LAAARAGWKSAARPVNVQHGIEMTLIERADESETIGDDGYRRIRADIVLGRLPPGHKLKLEGLKESYGVSVSTLREILSRLTSEGLVLAEGRRGFEVAPVSVDNLTELAELRLLLEGHAMEASFARADMEWEGRVVSAHHKLAATERLMGSQIGEPEQWKRYDSEFHRELISNCGSRALLETHAAVFDRYFRYQMIALNYRGEEPARQHQALLECALARDIKRAKAVLLEHVTGCVEHALAAGTIR